MKNFNHERRKPKRTIGEFRASVLSAWLAVEKKGFDLPFTLTGFAVFLCAFIILVRSLAARNAYEIVLSLTALALWAALLLAGRWAVRRLAALGGAAFQPSWKIPFPLTAASAGEWQVTGVDARVPLFFRLHFLVRGRFFPQGEAEGCAVSAEASMPRARCAAEGNPARLALSFPMGGLFRGETSCRLRDIFGLFSFPCEGRREEILKVRSAPCGLKALRIDAQAGAEDRRDKNANDEERYYMREYAPGDRFRDINWKSSERINTLITRISPDNQEKVTRIEVYFRNYRPHSPQGKRGKHDAPALSDLWLLDRAKARLAWFLRKAREENSSYIFHVRSARASWDLNDDDEIEAFLDELSALPFFPPQNEESSLPAVGGETYIFSTACDATLPAFLLSLQGKPFSLFLTQNAQPKKTQAAGAQNEQEADCFFLRDFPAGGFVPLARWLLPRRKPPLNAHASRIMIDYAETRL
ncbi:MAG: DUF58 domain-containing protein [Treponema sp.]|nr:DUF58 domain-containing protein [Treponema sp.]